MSNSTAILPPEKKDIKYTKEEVFVWLIGERAPTAQKLNKDFESTIKRKVIAKHLLPENERNWTLDQLIEKYPCPTTWEDN